MNDIANLWKFDLRQGSTDHPRNGACLYDAANWIIYGTVGDDPPSACPVIRAYAFRLNDLLPNDQRQRLKRFILRVVDNRDPASEPARAEYLARRTVDVITPMARRATRSTALADDAVGLLASVSAAGSAGADAILAEAATADAGWEGVAEYAADVVEAAAKAISSTRTKNRLYAAAIETLDGVLEIGKQADPFDEETVRLAIATFDRARRAWEPVGIA